MEGERATIFVIRTFYGEPSQYIWEDDCAAVHIILRGEGGVVFLSGTAWPRILRAGEHMFSFFE